jgi:hypothetical protein
LLLLYTLWLKISKKSIYNKEDGSVASFVKLPNGKVLGKSKMSFESDQAVGINRVYNTNEDVKNFVDWTLDDNGIDATLNMYHL